MANSSGGGGVNPWLIALQAGLGLAGGLFGGNSQNPYQTRNSFEGHGTNDPNVMLSGGVGKTNDAIDAIIAQLGQGVSLPGAVAQTPMAFSGGGLPMAIGVNGVDPALADPSILSRPGVQMRGSGGSNGGLNTNQGTPANPKYAVPRPPGAKGPTTYMEPHPDKNPMIDTGTGNPATNAFDEAYQALDLLGVNR